MKAAILTVICLVLVNGAPAQEFDWQHTETVPNLGSPAMQMAEARNLVRSLEGEIGAPDRVAGVLRAAFYYESVELLWPDHEGWIVTAKLAQGELFLREEMYGNAMKSFKAALRRSTSEAQGLRALAGLGWAYHHLGRSTYADDTFDELTTRANAMKNEAPGDVIGSLVEAATYQRAVGRGAKAAALYRKAATLKSDASTRRCTYLLMAMDVEGRTDRQQGRAHLNQLEACAARMRAESDAGWAEEKRIIDNGIERWKKTLR